MTNVMAPTSEFARRRHIGSVLLSNYFVARERSKLLEGGCEVIERDARWLSTVQIRLKHGTDLIVEREAHRAVTLVHVVGASRHREGHIVGVVRALRLVLDPNAVSRSI